MEDISIPIATLVGSEIIDYDNLKYKHSIICENIKSLRDTFMEFCETMEEFETIISSIEKDPYSYETGKPILKKYAQALIECKILEQQIEKEEEIKNDVTPQELKKDMRHYISICEKKITKTSGTIDRCGITYCKS